MIMGTISNFIKTTALTAKWQERQKNLGSAPEDSIVSALFPKPNKKENAARVSSIMGRMKSGLEPTSEELVYLRANAPEFYRKAVQILAERREHREQLLRCRSKDEARRLNNGKMMQIVGGLKTATGAAADSGARLDALEFSQMRTAAIQSEYLSFTGGPRYQRLPEESARKKEAPQRLFEKQQGTAKKKNRRGFTRRA